jgi:hypothetical protein
MALPKRDRLAELAEGMQRIAAADQLTVRASRKASVDPAALSRLLDDPDAEFPAAVEGVSFASRREVRIALWNQLPKKDRPAFLQDAHERAAMWTKMSLARDEKKVKRINVTINNNMIQIPAPAAALPASDVKRMTRDERGQLRAIDAEVVK